MIWRMPSIKKTRRCQLGEKFLEGLGNSHSSIRTTCLARERESKSQFLGGKKYFFPLRAETSALPIQFFFLFRDEFETFFSFPRQPLQQRAKMSIQVFDNKISFFSPLSFSLSFFWGGAGRSWMNYLVAKTKSDRERQWNLEITLCGWLA